MVYMALIARVTQKRGRILFVHALKNASNSIVTVIGLGIALLIGADVCRRVRPGLRGHSSTHTYACHFPVEGEARNG